MRRARLVVVSVCVLLFGVAVTELVFDWNRLLPPGRTRQDVRDAEFSHRLVVPRRNDDLSGFLSAPAFDPERRPLTLGTETAGATGPHDLALIGIVQSEESFAVVRTRSGGETRRLKSGDAYGGFRLKEIASDTVVFAGPSGDVTLTIEPKAH